MNKSPPRSTTTTTTTTTLTDASDLLQIGVCKIDMTTEFTIEELSHWAQELSQVTPMNTFAEDGEYAFYRNILDEEGFPFERIWKVVSPVFLRHFQDDNNNSQDDNNSHDDNDVESWLRLDDAFCIHYNMKHDDTSGKKHMDPSDITVNFCLERSDDTVGSEVAFFGRKELHGVTHDNHHHEQQQQQEEKTFLVEQDAGWATIHHGGHYHQTMELKRGVRTNIVLTYCYKDENKSGAMRTCYA